jgi:hypothetical protein
MATFPSLQALFRAYSLTPRTSSIYETDTTRAAIVFRHGIVATNRPIEFGFPSITLSDANLILTHYLGERQHGRFMIPVTLWQILGLYEVTPANQLYKYNAPVLKEYIRNSGLYNVNVSLKTVL